MTDSRDVEAMDTRCEVCPFCQEKNLNAIGLKKHLMMWCATFRNLPPIQRPFYG